MKYETWGKAFKGMYTFPYVIKVPPRRLSDNLKNGIGQPPPLQFHIQGLFKKDSLLGESLR